MQSSECRLSQRVLLTGLCVYALLVPVMQSPYAPIWGNALSSGRLQIVDVVLLVMVPFGLMEFVRDRGRSLLPYRWPLIALGAYLLVVAMGVRASHGLGAYFELASAGLLGITFVFILLVVREESQVRLILKFLLGGLVLTIALSWFGIMAYYLTAWKWSYVLQENHIFPYLGDVVRLTGPFKPTAKLLSTYLTLAIPALIAFTVLVEKRQPRLFLIALSIAGIAMYPLTISRGIVGFVFAVSFILYVCSHNSNLLRWISRLGFLLAVAAFFVTLAASTIFVVDKEFSYRFDENPSHPHTVYHYYHPERGREELNLRVAFARDHYYWLKKSAVEIVRENPFGVGNGQFSAAVTELQMRKIIPVGLANHTTPQGEFFYAAAERGWLGVLTVVLLFLSWIWKVRPIGADLAVAASFGALIAVCFIDSLYLEITRFRFLWFYAAFFLVYARLIGTNGTNSMGIGRCG